jgi:hypothetical protein
MLFIAFVVLLLVRGAPACNAPPVRESSHRNGCYENGIIDCRFLVLLAAGQPSPLRLAPHFWIGAPGFVFGAQVCHRDGIDRKQTFTDHFVLSL